MMRVFATLLVTLGFAVPIGAQQTTQPPAPKPADNGPVFIDNAHLRFTTTRFGPKPLIYQISVDGSDEHPASGNNGLLSPDGKQLLSTVRSRDASGLHASLVLAKPDGSDPHPLPSPLPMAVAGAWAPDGRHILLTAGTPSASRTVRPEMQIFTMNLDGTDARPLIPGSAHPYQIEPSYSPDGRHIVYTEADADTGRTTRIMVADADGSHPHAISVAGPGTQWPRWSPDGKKIAYWSDRTGNGEIYVVNADGTGEVRLTTTSAHNETPAWSPDGRQIAFQSDRDGEMTLYIMNADGSGVHRVRRP